MSDIIDYMRDVYDNFRFLEHVGVAHDENPPGRGSGRYAFGSGENAYQHVGREFYDKYLDLKKSGMSEKDIAAAMNCYDKYGNPSTGRLRGMASAAKNRVRRENVARARELQAQGYNNSEIARMMGLPRESSVRSLLNGTAATNAERAEITANELKRVLEEEGKFIDIGQGVEKELSLATGLNITDARLSEALYLLEEEGYVIDSIRMPQANNLAGNKTTVRLLAPPGTPKEELRDYSRWTSYMDYMSHDNGDTIVKVNEYPQSMDSSRLMVRYSEDGGKEKDGVMEIRRGCADLDLQGSHYCQARILVDDTHYIKGMAVYGDDNEFPPGVDVIFNTNKTKDVPIMSADPKATTVLKPIKDDPENPFGSLVKDIDRGGQYYYTDPKTGEKKLGLINKTRDEGDWDDWSDSLPSQFISKQPKSLIDKQLNLTIADKQAEYEEILTVTNPTLRKKLLLDYAGKCDKAAVDLKASSLPGQKYRVILPLTTAKDNEVYAPNLKEGTTVALIRFPHAGPFEIPILRVNNSIPEGDRMITKNAIDAVGVNSRVANMLSGADFDGDTVMVIPLSDSVRITGNPDYKNVKAFKELENFDPHTEYAARAGMKYMTKDNTQREMGIISNLITDMYIQGASADELVRATKHSMVIIDAEKHKLDYKRSEKENRIKELKEKYQKDPENPNRHGASTIISKAKSEERVTKRQGQPRIRDDGTIWYKTADDAFYYDKKGNLVEKTTKSTKMAETSDAFDLVSDINNPVEVAYAKFANNMKAKATEARRVAKAINDNKPSKSAYLAYKADIDNLLEQVEVAERNAPRERRAQAIANANIKKSMDRWREDNPAYTDREYKAQKKKISTKELTKARNTVNAKRTTITLTDRQWQAINLDAVNKTTLEKIFKYADMDDVRARSMPREKVVITPGKEAMIKAMKSSGFSNAEIAERVGVSRSAVSNYLKGELEAKRKGN